MPPSIQEGGLVSDLLESFPINILERNEVIKGPGSVLYGSNASSLGDPFANNAEAFVENGKVRFAINPASALRARVRISSKLLALAKLVKDEKEADR